MELTQKQIEAFLKLHKDFLSAARQGNVTVLRGYFLLAKFRGYDLTLLRTRRGCNALHSAAYYGHTEACKYLIETIKFDVNCADVEGETPLFQALWNGHWPTAKYLIESGANVTKSNKYGATPLHCATKKGSREIVELLLSRGADLHATSSHLGEPLHSAAMHGNAVVLKFLLDHNADPNSFSLKKSPLLLSMQADSIECMELLLKEGADSNHGSKYPDHASKFQTTPLCFAAAKPNLQMTQCLLKYEADPNKKDHKGKKALEYAAMMNCHEAVELLFPKTEPIALYTEWSVNGILQHAQTEQAKQKELCLKEKEKGNEAVAQKDYASAKDCYSRAIEAYWTDAEVQSRLLSNRSYCWVHLNEGSKALNDAWNCVQLDSGWSKGHYRVGAALNLLKDYEEAVEAFDRALSLEPGNKDAESARRKAEDALEKQVKDALMAKDARDDGYL